MSFHWIFWAEKKPPFTSTKALLIDFVLFPLSLFRLGCRTVVNIINHFDRIHGTLGTRWIGGGEKDHITKSKVEAPALVVTGKD